ncbi:amidohydrolase [Enterococcus sp. PF1-24]|uniref:M20 metallopeptidase family protein n=1 Tax=unclassified Enterococcus TaxID=2608891 RepID=UPI00247560EA|nr:MULTISPECIES: M20 family metallopeptidase [unclassified Enterococcus]MDH6365801.1 amidohydrolase [Enterococcus sp. PFB1-1]MDH6402907.1 amidohydrolase [Enterococcus sp. PF1-24]
MTELFNEAKMLQDELVEMRRTLHRNPEIGMDLPKTMAFTKQKLKALGLKPEVVGQSGLTVTIGEGDKCFLIRGDMDALPIKEESGEPFSSENENMHACGHDFHTTMLYGAAKLLKAHEAELPGKVKLMFQPGEEILAGAKAMVAEGILENPKVDAAMMIHVFPGLPIKSGTVLVPEAGPFASTSDWFEIKIQGKGGHAATPEKSINPLTVMSHIHLALHALEAREISMYDQAVISTTIMNGGVVDNAIPDTAYMKGSIRTFDQEVRNFIFKRIPEIAEGVARAFGATVDAKIIEGCPTVAVDGEVTEDLREALTEAFPGEVTSPKACGMDKLGGSEDFSYVTQEVPSTMLLLASGHSDEYPYFVHHPKVIFDEEVLSKGAAVYTISAMEWLKKHS